MRAQLPERVRRVGVLMAFANDQVEQSLASAFRQGLQELGWTDGANLRIAYRWTAPDGSRTRVYAAELIAMPSDVILATNTQSMTALSEVSHTIPIVFVSVADPLAAGLVQSLARPRGNITGFSSIDYGTSEKWLELLKETNPDLVRAGVVYDQSFPQSVARLHVIEAAARSLAIRV
jgi:putative tryptophan/tyrosine transport system substrate-binding protein